MAWIRLRLDSTADECERLSEALFDVGATSVVHKPADEIAVSTEDPAQAVWEPRPGEAPLWDRVSVEAFFSLDADLAACRELLGRRPLEIDFLEESDFSETWRNQTTQQFGRLFVVPLDSREDWPLDAALVRLDPGLAFGSGTHATTALCLAWLERHLEPGAHVLDVGSGSGILSVAALKLGASDVTAVDYDAQARMATVDNATRNDVGGNVTVHETLDQVPGRFDVVVANILAAVLIELADDLVDRVALGGELVLSGVLENQRDWVQAAFRDFDWVVDRRQEWLLLHGRRAS